MERMTQITLFVQEQPVRFAQAVSGTLVAHLTQQALRTTAEALVQGLLVAQTPHVTKAMQMSVQTNAWAAAKRGYRLPHFDRVTTQRLTKTGPAPCGGGTASGLDRRH